jgi:hypothetical protein
LLGQNEIKFKVRPYTSELLFDQNLENTTVDRKEPDLSLRATTALEQPVFL